MKYLRVLFIFFIFVLISCKKESIDGSSIKTFQESINDMSSNLTTLKQIKFNEALFVLKNYGVQGDSDFEKLVALSKLIDGRKVSEIFKMADEVAQKNNLEWASNAEPSLGNMNIFEVKKPSERDVNDIDATSIDLVVKETKIDSITGVKSLQVIPKLISSKGSLAEFSNASLEQTTEVYSDGVKIFTSKKILTDNHSKGVFINTSKIALDKIINGTVDIKVTIKTANGYLQANKNGINIVGQVFSYSNEKYEESQEKEENKPTNVKDSLTINNDNN